VPRSTVTACAAFVKYRRKIDPIGGMTSPPSYPIIRPCKGLPRKPAVTTCNNRTGGGPATIGVSRRSVEAERTPQMGSQTVPRSCPIRILRLAQVIEMTGLGKTKIYELQSEGSFPMRVEITAHSVGWIEEEVQAWLAKRVASSTSLPARRPYPEVQAAFPVTAKRTCSDVERRD
jgi:prophage regulatory protein